MEQKNLLNLDVLEQKVNNYQQKVILKKIEEIIREI